MRTLENTYTDNAVTGKSKINKQLGNNVRRTKVIKIKMARRFARKLSIDDEALAIAIAWEEEDAILDSETLEFSENDYQLGRNSGIDRGGRYRKHEKG